MRRVIFSSKSNIAYFPIYDTLNLSFVISTRAGNSVAIWGDGSENNISNTKIQDLIDGYGVSTSHLYSTPYTGNFSIKFINGLSDVYSIRLNGTNTVNTNKWNLDNIENFFKQFSNLYSILISDFSNNTAIFKGDFAKLPNSVERIYIEILNVIGKEDLVVNFSNYNSGSLLKQFRSHNASLRLIGNLSKLPVGCQYFYVNSPMSPSSISYIGTKVWASAFDTLLLPVPLPNATQTNNLLIDMNNSISTAIGDKIINLKGYRTSISDPAVAGLIAKTFTVICARMTEKVIMPLAVNLLDQTEFANHATMVGTETHLLDGLVTSKNNYAYIANNSSLQIGTGSIRMGCTIKFGANNTSIRGIAGKVVQSMARGSYGFYLSGGVMYADAHGNSRISSSVSIAPYLDGNFHTLELIHNRQEGVHEFIIDGEIIDTKSFAANSTVANHTTNFMIGAYAASAGGILANTEFDGIIKDVFFNTF